MHSELDLTNITAKNIYPLGDAFQGTTPDGRKLGFTNYYMTMDDQPFFGISGEYHFSRVLEDEWEDSVLKCKAGGINIIATYVLWNVHEEDEGHFRWDGRRNLRKFLAICKKHDMLVILRIGPFDHGEMRNGGMPDWLYGKPFDVRTTNPAFLAYVRKFFKEINAQTEGYYFSEGGPVIAAQLDNEYMHSSAPWEQTTGTSQEWINGGHEGDAYLIALKKLMIECGIRTPFYTCTAWGGARTPVDEALPLWGGYAYWPWMFYDTAGVHPATPEYIYRDNHNNAVKKTYNFEPRYEPESRPYACCEMMGGMTSFYHYRFALPYESVDALANVKIASGCNFAGYYMYRGGMNPVGAHTFLNENTTPKINYDYQAPIGENGQLRPSWSRLRLVHYFCRQFADELVETKTVNPSYMESLEPEDTSHLRFCMRVKGGKGFIFLNNFQDHMTMPARYGDSVTLHFPENDLTIDDISLASGENAILPVNQDLDGVRVKYALAQPMIRRQTKEGVYWFFFAPKGMKAKYVFDGANVAAVSGTDCVKRENGTCEVAPAGDDLTLFAVELSDGRKVNFVTMSREEALKFYVYDLAEESAFLADGGLMQDGDRLVLEIDKEEEEICAWPASAAAVLKSAGGDFEHVTRGMFEGVRAVRDRKDVEIPLTDLKEVGYYRYTLTIDPSMIPEDGKTFLNINYTGDIGHIFIDGRLINDDFANGRTFETRIDLDREALKKYPVTIMITPLKEGARVNTSSTMAGRMEEFDSVRAGIRAVSLHYVTDLAIYPWGLTSRCNFEPVGGRPAEVYFEKVKFGLTEGDTPSQNVQWGGVSFFMADQRARNGNIFL